MNTGRIVLPGHGRRVRVGPNELTIKAEPETGHTLATVFESRLPPGGGFPFPHVHDEYEEVFYVLEGEIEYRIGDDWTAVAAGTTVCVPPGVVHAFRNASHEPARHLALHAPAAALAMIEEAGQVPRERLAAVLAKHHTRLTEG